MSRNHCTSMRMCMGIPVNNWDPSGRVTLAQVGIAISSGALLLAGFTVLSNYASGRPLLSGVLEAMLLGAVVGAMILFAPALLPLLVAVGGAAAATLVFEVWRDPDSSNGQKLAAIIVLASAGFGVRPSSQQLRQFLPRSPSPRSSARYLRLGDNAKLKDIYPYIKNNDYVHLTIDPPIGGVIVPGVAGRSSWARWGDVKRLSLAQYRNDYAGKFSVASSPEANLMVVVGRGSIRRQGVTMRERPADAPFNNTGIREFTCESNVRPDYNVFKTTIQE